MVTLLATVSASVDSFTAHGLIPIKEVLDRIRQSKIGAYFGRKVAVVCICACS